MSSTSGDLRIDYSQAVLDNAGILSLSVDASVMDRAERVMFEEVYASVGQRVGTRITFMDAPTRGLMSVTAIAQIVGHCVMPDQLSRLREALQVNHIRYVTSRMWGLIVNQGGGKLHVVLKASRPSGLGQTSDELAALDSEAFGDSVSKDGPIMTMFNLAVAAAQAKYQYEFSVHSDSDRLYEVFDTPNAHSARYVIVRR